MWLVVAWTLVASFGVAVCTKLYYSVLSFRRHAAQVARQVRLHMQLKEWSLAEQKLLPLLKKRSYRRQHLFDYMRILRGLDRFEEVDKLLAEAGRLRSRDERFFLEVAHKAYRYGAYKEAAQAFARVPKEHFEEIDAARFASSFVRLRHLDAACSIIRPWSHIAHHEIAIVVGDIHFLSKRYSDAIEFYSKACELAPCPVEVCYNLAHSYRICHLYPEADRLFRTLLADPNYKEEALFNIGLCEQKQGHFRKALLIYQSSERWGQGDALMMKYAAIAATELQDYQLAASCWEVAFRCPTTEEDWRCGLQYGSVLFRLARYAEAETVYLRIVQRYPDCLMACKAIAWLVGVGCAEKASQAQGLHCAKRAVELKRSSATLELLSACEARVGNFDVAYEIQSYLVQQDLSVEQKRRRAQIMRNLRQKLPLERRHVVEVEALLAA